MNVHDYIYADLLCQQTPNFIITSGGVRAASHILILFQTRFSLGAKLSAEFGAKGTVRRTVRCTARFTIQ